MRILHAGGGKIANQALNLRFEVMELLLKSLPLFLEHLKATRFKFLTGRGSHRWLTLRLLNLVGQ